MNNVHKIHSIIVDILIEMFKYILRYSILLEADIDYSSRTD